MLENEIAIVQTNNTLKNNKNVIQNQLVMHQQNTHPNCIAPPPPPIPQGPIHSNPTFAPVIYVSDSAILPLNTEGAKTTVHIKDSKYNFYICVSKCSLYTFYSNPAPVK